MATVSFDHIEVHVNDISRYAAFLEALFLGGRSRQISDSGTSMFIAPDGTCIEIKAHAGAPDTGTSGFRLPCVRMEGARSHIEDGLGFAVDKTVENPDGEVHFFTDHEGVTWHIKDYAHRDRYVDW